MGTKFTVKVIELPGARLVGWGGSCRRVKMVLAAPRLMLEIAALVVPVF